MPANKLRKVIAQRDEFQHTHWSVEVYQHVEVAVLTLFSADVGAEQGKRRHTVLALQFRHVLLQDARELGGLRGQVGC